MRAGVVFVLISAVMAAYFGYFTLYGSHGIVNYARLLNQIDLRQAELTAVKAEREALERRVKMLSPESIDPDLLDERARLGLGYTQGDELVILKERP